MFGGQVGVFAEQNPAQKHIRGVRDPETVQPHGIVKSPNGAVAEAAIQKGGHVPSSVKAIETAVSVLTCPPILPTSPLASHPVTRNHRS